MLDNKKIISSWLICVFLVTFLSVFQYFYPKYIEELYFQKDYPALNEITRASGEQSLQFYAGKSEELLTGPVSSLVMGMVFLIFSFLYLRRVNVFVFAGAVAAYFFISRREVLFYPPYGDALIGPFSDAIWLLRHQFNYPAYWQVDSFLTGGPQVYPTSIYPGFLALLMKLAGSAKIFLVSAHLLVFLMAGMTAAVFRSILRKIFNDDLALAGSFLLLSHPLFQSMSELINMEMPSLLSALLAVYFLIDRRVYWAVFWSFISLMIKGPGAIACICVFLGSLILYITRSKEKGRIAPVLVSGILCGLVLVKMKARNAIIGGNVSHNNISFLSGWDLVRDKMYLWVYVVIVIGLILRIIYLNLKERKGVRRILSERFSPAMMILTTGLWFLVHANFSALIYRYELLLLPFLLFTIIYVFNLVFKDYGFLKGIMICVTGIFFLSSYGLFYQGQRVIGYLYPQIERSLEYRNDLKLHMALAREVEQKKDGIMIGAPLFMALALNFPEFGYVSNPVDVMVYEISSQHEGINNFQGLDNQVLQNTVWIGFERDSFQKSGVDYPIGPKDKVIHKIQRGDKEGVLFMGGFAIEERRLIFEQQRLR